MLASCFARTSGWRRPATSTAVPISTRSVTTAMPAHQTIGSYHGSFGSHLIVPSSVNGYREVTTSGITTWSLVQIESKPAASARRAGSARPSVATSGP
jgi:hypothetical protein